MRFTIVLNLVSIAVAFVPNGHIKNNGIKGPDFFAKQKSSKSVDIPLAGLNGSSSFAVKFSI